MIDRSYEMKLKFTSILLSCYKSGHRL